MTTIYTNDIAIISDRFGNESDETILLISGLGTQMIRWTDGFCTMLAEHGFQVIRFDNRDTGGSTHFTERGVPDFATLAAALAQGNMPKVPYTLTDMAQDAIGLLDSLAIDRAHLVGRSMGGMIAQVIASSSAERVLSLTSIMSSSGNPALPAAAPTTMALMTRPAPDPTTDLDGYVDHALIFARHLAGSGTPFDAESQRAIVIEEVRRAYDPGAVARQLAAIALDGDRRIRLARITAPTLVIHGSDDPLFPPVHGEDTAAVIPGADFLLIEGMGHEIPTALNARIADAITRHAKGIVSSTS